MRITQRRSKTPEERETLETWGRNLRTHRRSHGMSQAALGAALDPPVDPGTVSRWEQGIMAPPLLRKYQISRVLNLSPTILFPLGSGRAS